MSHTQVALRALVARLAAETPPLHPDAADMRKAAAMLDLSVAAAPPPGAYQSPNPLSLETPEMCQDFAE